MPSTRTSRSASPPESNADTANEVTSLLPPSTSAPSQPHHARKTSVSARSVSGRSVAGSVRGYGAVNTNNKPSPAAQVPRVSKQGQRRIITTWPIQLTFFTLVALEFLSFTLTVILFINTGADLNIPFLPYRGSGFAEFWLSLVGSWIGFGGVLFFSHPSFLFFITTLFTFLLLLPTLLLVLIAKPIAHAHAPLFLIPFFLTLLTLFFSLLANYLVRRARRLESERIFRMLTDVAGRERSNGEEGVARALVGIQGKGVWGRFVGFVFGVLGLIAGLAGMVIIILLLIDFSISAFDSSLQLPSVHSRKVSVQPTDTPWRINIHIACVPPPNRTDTAFVDATKPFPRKPKTLPTILYEAGSGVPGSLALLDYPPIPTNEDVPIPGKWLLDMQREGEVGTVCVWDRPGYGFSEVLGGADLAKVAEALWLALDTIGERHNKFTLVGEGYGGLVSRIFAADHPSHIHSILHLDAQTAQTYFSESPRGMSVPGLLAHRVTTRLLPALITPLSITRFPSLILRRSSSLSRILASSRPKPSNTHLNENIQKARLQETFGAHSHTSSSFRALLESWQHYPSTTPAIVISSQKRMDELEGWAEGQKGLAEEVTSDKGLVRWDKVPGVGHGVCESDEGLDVCQKAVRSLLAL